MNKQTWKQKFKRFNYFICFKYLKQNINKDIHPRMPTNPSFQPKKNEIL